MNLNELRREILNRQNVHDLVHGHNDIIQLKFDQIRKIFVQSFKAIIYTLHEKKPT